jgi:hypothetical protein
LVNLQRSNQGVLGSQTRGLLGQLGLCRRELLGHLLEFDRRCSGPH